MMLRFLFLGIWVFLASCLSPESSVCSDGSVCPSVLVCQEEGSCVDRGQLAACTGLIEDAKCSTTFGEGFCIGGLCVSENCGDGLLAKEEACDDGNALGGDGCSARCDKIEICGDSIVDEGEACDDGNLTPADGCDACVETVWQARTIIAAEEENALALPKAIAYDVAGNLYIGDRSNASIRRLDAKSGKLTAIVGTIENGFSRDGGKATTADFGYVINSLVVDGLGNIFVADGHRVWRIDAQTGIATTVAGGGKKDSYLMEFQDGELATNLWLNIIHGLVVDGQGNFYISEAYRVHRVDGQSGIITTIVGTGYKGYSGDGGLAIDATLSLDVSMALDNAGNLFLAATEHHRVRRVDATTNIITTIAGTGIPGDDGDDGDASHARLLHPRGLTIDRSGNLFIAMRNRVRRIDAKSNIITTIAGNGTRGSSGDNGAAIEAQVAPYALTIDGEDNLIIGESSHRIRRVDMQTKIISTIAGDGSYALLDDHGFASSAGLLLPEDACVDKDGNLFIAETSNHRIRRVDSQSGIITTIAGNGNPGFAGDDGPAKNAQLLYPSGVVVDDQGNLFIADRSNHRIRRVDAKSNIITTVVGNGSRGFSGDNGPALDAQLDNPSSVVVDGKGNLFIADKKNNRIRRIDAKTGIIVTMAGNGNPGSSGDGGPASEASFTPEDVTLDTSGNLFIAEGYSRIRRIDAQSSVITTVAGAGPRGFSGDGGLATAATLSNPQSVTIDDTGNLFIADSRNQRIRRVDAQSNVITTVAGTGTKGFSGDNGLAINAQFTSTKSVAIDSAGNLFIVMADRIRRIDKASGIITTVAGNVQPPGMGPVEHSKLPNPRQMIATTDGLLIAGGTSGTIQGFNNNTLRTLTGRYRQGIATANWARFRSDSFGTIEGIAMDAKAGLLYVSETSNHRIQIITMVNPVDSNSWTIDILAGGEEGFKDGALSDARFRYPSGLFLDGKTLYVADAGNHSIRALNLDNRTIKTIAGNSTERGYFGEAVPGTSALLFNPQTLTKCPNGDLFIADTGNHRIRRLENASGLITTVLGDGVPANSGQGIPAYLFPVHTPLGITCDSAGNVFVSSTQGIRLLSIDDDGIVDGTGKVQTIYGTSPRENYPENLTRCLTGILSIDDSHLQFTDACVGMLIELELRTL